MVLCGVAVVRYDSSSGCLGPLGLLRKGAIKNANPCFETPRSLCESGVVHGRALARYCNLSSCDNCRLETEWL